jgi:hypothetical protein
MPVDNGHARDRVQRFFEDERAEYDKANQKLYKRR